MALPITMAFLGPYLNVNQPPRGPLRFMTIIMNISARDTAALLHPKLGTPLRNAVGGGKAIIPSVKKIGRMGDGIDIPLHFKDAAFVRSHFDGMTVSVNDAPKGDEILVAVAVTAGGRPHARVGGLKKEEAKGEDGLR